MPFMKVCPRCGAERAEARPLEAVDKPPAESPRVPPIDPSRFVPDRDSVLLSPEDVNRRFPLFTNAQLTLFGIGFSLLVLMGVIAWLLWQQNKRDQVTWVGSPPSSAGAPLAPIPAITPEPLPTPTPITDESLVESVKAALTAYNPTGIENYRIEVKDGVVTLMGTVEHEPESNGAENVVKLVNGVKSVVNNLKLKPGQPSGTIRLNTAEARLLDEAMRRQAAGAPPEGVKPQPAQPDTAQREAERLRREQQAARQREEELALRKAAEDRLKRDAEEFNRRQEEIRRLEAERRARAEQSRADISVLRSGTVAWSGLVDGVDEIILTGGSASVRHLSGNPPREIKVSFSAPLPRAPAEVKLIASNGRGRIDILQQPAASNGYTAIIRIDDSGKGGDKRYDFTLRWMLQ